MAPTNVTLPPTGSGSPAPLYLSLVVMALGSLAIIITTRRRNEPDLVGFWQLDAEPTGVKVETPFADAAREVGRLRFIGVGRE